MTTCKTCGGTGKYDGTPEGMRMKCVDCYCADCDFAPCECIVACALCGLEGHKCNCTGGPHVDVGPDQIA